MRSTSSTAKESVINVYKIELVAFKLSYNCRSICKKSLNLSNCSRNRRITYLSSMSDAIGVRIDTADIVNMVINVADSDFLDAESGSG